MSDVNDFTVVDARQAFIKWNCVRLNNVKKNISNEAEKYIHLIPFFFQLNHKLLPGYVDISTPVGVFSYEPEINEINEVKALNNKFRYQCEGIINNYAVESIFFQKKLVDNKKYCWVFYNDNLGVDKIKSLNDKTLKIEQWFSIKKIKIKFIFLSIVDFHINKMNFVKNKSLFVDEFYAESILLAGKYPVWWLVPPNKENEYKKIVDHIKHARFVDQDEYLDLGSVSGFELSDIVEDAVRLVQESAASAEICLVELLLLNQSKSVFPLNDGVSSRIKNDLYLKNNNVSCVDHIVKIMYESFSRFREIKHILSPIRLFSRIASSPGYLNMELVDGFLGENNEAAVCYSGLDSVVENLKFYKSMSYDIRMLFEAIVMDFVDNNGVSASDDKLIVIVENMLLYLSDGDSRVHLYNTKNSENIIFDRIHLKQVESDINNQWKLVLNDANNEKKIEGFNCLLGLLAWCWLNRLVNNLTQVSVDSSGKKIKQIDAYSILEVLIQQLNPKSISNVSSDAFKQKAIPVQSLLFIDFDGLVISSRDKFLHCEQLIVDSWGEVYTKIYTGNSGVLSCLCDWTHQFSIGTSEAPPRLQIYGHGSGDSASIAQRIDKIFSELKAFFYQKGHAEGRFFVKLSSEYFLMQAIKSKLQVEKIVDFQSLLTILEMPLSVFKLTAIESLTATEFPLYQIYKKNKPHVVQVFYQIINRSGHVWVLDEKGSLWSDVLDVYDRESYLAHWLYLFKNIRLILKQLNNDGSILPELEINHIYSNKLGKLEIHRVAADTISPDKNFMDIKISVIENKKVEEFNMSCDTNEFLYEKHKKMVFSHAIDYLLDRNVTNGRLPVYVTAIDMPVKLFNVNAANELQTIHILKIKRNFEHRINKSLDG